MVRQTPRPAPAPTALIVDPDADTRSLYALALRPFFPEVSEAEDGAEALALAMARPPRLVVTELRLPRLDGYALCTLLRQEPLTRGSAIVVVTGSALPLDTDRARRAGADVVLVKPCTPEKLLQSGRALMSRDAVEQPPAEPARPADTARRRFIREVTRVPPTAPPQLRCPRCDQILQYDHTYIGGVSAARRERWDHFACASCGRFVYRHRTRKLRAVTG